MEAIATKVSEQYESRTDRSKIESFDRVKSRESTRWCSFSFNGDDGFESSLLRIEHDWGVSSPTHSHGSGTPLFVFVEERRLLEVAPLC